MLWQFKYHSIFHQNRKTSKHANLSLDENYLAIFLCFAFSDQ